MSAVEHLPVVDRIERSETTVLEAVDTLLAEELTLRESRRVKTALVMALVELKFVGRCERSTSSGRPAPARDVRRSPSASKRAVSTSPPWPTGSAPWRRHYAKELCVRRSTFATNRVSK